MYAERTNTYVIMYVVDHHVRFFFTNIYIIMYVAVSHVRSNVKQNPIKICPLAAFYVFLCFPSAAKGPCSAPKT